MERYNLGIFSDLHDRTPNHKMVNDLELVDVKCDQEFSVLYGRCLHHGALMSDVYIDGQNLMCGLYGWEYRMETGVSDYNKPEALEKFSIIIGEDIIYIV